MIQTDMCAVCRGGIYRDIDATWEIDDASWLHMNPELVITPHIAHPSPRSIDDDNAVE